MKKFFAMLVATMLCMSMSFAAFAAEATEVLVGSEVVAEEAGSDDGIMPLFDNVTEKPVGADSGFVTVYTRPSAVDRFVKIEALRYVIRQNGAVVYDSGDYNAGDYQMDIIMWGANGILWREDDCLHNNNNRIFEVSAACTSISVRIIPRNKLIFKADYKPYWVKATY